MRDIDPTIQLSFNIHANPGVFALLLGSGVSRSAGIPTGWEVVLDLVRKLATAEGEAAVSDPENWYVSKYGHEPTYSDLLEKLAPTADLRQALLRGYFEPTEEERQQGKKIPTEAHCSIARLVRRGAFRVIITTNFDRLLEAALEETGGIVPTVIRNSDDTCGAIPLVHSGCTVIKVHGDYLDTRIKNSPEELAIYDPRMNEILDRVFDEFGLIVCGWSAEYDEALYAAIRRSPSRRYPIYWANRGSISTRAADIIQFRRAEVIEISGADELFSGIEEKHEAISSFSQPHPLSRISAIQSTKRYVSEERHRIQLHDFVISQAKKTNSLILDIQYKSTSDGLTHGIYNNLLRSYESSVELMQGMLAAGSYFSPGDSASIWSEAFDVIGSREEHGNGFVVVLSLQKYPSLLLKYVIGISAVLTDNYESFARICLLKPSRKHGDKERYGLLLDPIKVLSHDYINAALNERLGAKSKFHTPQSQYICEVIREDFGDLGWEGTRLERAFDKFEYIQALVLMDIILTEEANKQPYGPPGAYRWRSWGGYKGDYCVRSEIFAEMQGRREAWGPIRAGLFGGDIKRAEEAFEKLNEFLASSYFFSWS